MNEGMADLNLSHYCFQEIGLSTLEHRWWLKEIIGICWELCFPHFGFIDHLCSEIFFIAIFGSV